MNHQSSLQIVVRTLFWGVCILLSLIFIITAFDIRLQFVSSVREIAARFEVGNALAAKCMADIHSRKVL